MQKLKVMALEEIENLIEIISDRIISTNSCVREIRAKIDEKDRETLKQLAQLDLFQDGSLMKEMNRASSKIQEWLEALKEE